jgi:hypothetical protein
MRLSPSLLRTVSRLTVTARRSKCSTRLPGLPTATARTIANVALKPVGDDHDPDVPVERHLPEHAVISTFDLFSIGGPSPSLTLGPRLICSQSAPPHLTPSVLCALQRFSSRISRSSTCWKKCASNTLSDCTCAHSRVFLLNLRRSIPSR